MYIKCFAIFSTKYKTRILRQQTEHELVVDDDTFENNDVNMTVDMNK